MTPMTTTFPTPAVPRRRAALLMVAGLLAATPLVATLVGAALLLGAGCGGRPAPVDQDAARAALRTALDAWKAGQSPETLQAGSPAVTANDPDWTAGFKLEGYELAGEGEDDHLNLRCPVKLLLRDPQGAAVTRTVTFIVGTSPATTVFREFKM